MLQDPGGEATSEACTLTTQLLVEKGPMLSEYLGLEVNQQVGGAGDKQERGRVGLQWAVLESRL